MNPEVKRLIKNANELSEQYKQEVARLEKDCAEWKSKYDELKAENERLRVQLSKLAGSADNFAKLAEWGVSELHNRCNILEYENKALKEKADKMADVVEGIMSDNHRNEDGSWETPIYISEHLMPYLEQAYSNKLSQERADLIREVNNRDLGENKEVE